MISFSHSKGGRHFYVLFSSTLSGKICIACLPEKVVVFIDLKLVYIIYTYEVVESINILS